MSDTELIEGCRGKNKSKYQKILYNQLSTKMFATCLFYTGSREDAEDVLQEGFLKVFKYILKLENIGSLSGWIRKIMINTAFSKYRSNKFSNKLFEIHENTAIVKQENNIDFKKYLNIINSLPIGYSTVFKLSVIEGYSHKEIGNLLGIQEGTSRTQLMRARNFLKTKFKKEAWV